MRRHLLIILAALMVVSCKPPRSPRAAVESKVTGQWQAASPQGRWLLAIEDGEAGKIAGTGSLVNGSTERSFVFRGVRDKSIIKFEFRLSNAASEFKGSVMDSKTITGEMYLGPDTVPLAFTRE